MAFFFFSSHNCIKALMDMEHKRLVLIRNGEWSKKKRGIPEQIILRFTIGA